MAKKTKEPEVHAPSGVLPKSRLREKYSKDVAPKLMEQFGYKSTMQIPKLEKIVINMGTGSTDKDSKNLENSLRDLQIIAGQKPVTTHARKAISNFKLREGMKIGCKVTLRGERMLHFFDRLATVVLPRIRDFQGLSAKSFDGRGNYSVGLKEQLVFPEIPYDTFDRIRGMDIVFVTTAKTDEEARVFLKLMGLPIQEPK
jgi:large subunit ribosomal protein L5